MIKTAIWIIAGILLGLIIHLVIILSLPNLVPNNAWNILSKISTPGKLVILKRPKAMETNVLRLDPELVYAVCRFDLLQGPGSLSGKLPIDFWSVGIFDKTGVAIYSTTNRSGGDQNLDLGIFSPAQTRLLAEHQLTLKTGVIIVKAPSNEVYAVIRLATPHPAMWQRYKETLKQLKCAHIK